MAAAAFRRYYTMIVPTPPVLTPRSHFPEYFPLLHQYRSYSKQKEMEDNSVVPELSEELKEELSVLLTKSASYDEQQHRSRSYFFPMFSNWPQKEKLPEGDDTINSYIKHLAVGRSLSRPAFASSVVVRSSSLLLQRLRPKGDAVAAPAAAASSSFWARGFATSSSAHPSANQHQKEATNLPGDFFSLNLPPELDFDKWLVLMEKLGDPERVDDIINSRIKTLSKAVGSEEEARKKIGFFYKPPHGYVLDQFTAEVPKEVAMKIKDLPWVRAVYPYPPNYHLSDYEEPAPPSVLTTVFYLLGGYIACVFTLAYAYVFITEYLPNKVRDIYNEWIP